MEGQKYEPLKLEHLEWMITIFTLDWTKREVFENARMITISVFKNIHYDEALPQMLGERITAVPKVKNECL